MKYTDFYRLYGLDNGFDKIVDTNDIHPYSNYVRRTPKINNICFDTSKSVEEVVDILKNLPFKKYSETKDNFVVVVEVIDRTVGLCEIVRSTDSDGNYQYSIICTNDATSSSEIIDKQIEVFNSSEIMIDDTLIEKGWRKLKYVDRCYFYEDKRAVSVDFCFFNNDDVEFPKTYSYDELHDILGTKCGIITFGNYLIFNFTAGEMKVPLLNDKLVDYIDEEMKYVAFAASIGEQSTYLAICDTNGTIMKKQVSIPNFTLTEGTELSVYFLHADRNTSQSAENDNNVTLCINNGEEIPIEFDGLRILSSEYGGEYTNTLTAGWHTFYYDGMYWQAGLYQNKKIPSRFLLDEHTKVSGFYFNSDLSVAKVTAVLASLDYNESSGMTEHYDLADAVDTLYRINGAYYHVYSLNLSTSGGSGYALAVVTVNYSGSEFNVRKIVFVSEYSETNAAILQQVEPSFTFSKAGWVIDPDYIFESSTYIVPGNPAINALVTIDQNKTLWKMIKALTE